MKRLALIIVLLLIPAFAFAQQDSAPQHVAAGAEKEMHKEAHPAEDHGAGEHAPKTYFGIPGWILKLVNMILFIGLLAYLLKGPVGTAFRERREQIRAQLTEAQERRAKADALAGDIQARLAQIESDVKQIIDRAHDEGERQRREIIEAAKGEAEKILSAARNEVDARVKLARKEHTESAGELAAVRAKEILQQTITEGDQKKLFSESVDRISENPA